MWALRPQVAAAVVAALVGWSVLVTGVAPAAADDIRGKQWWLQALGVPAAHKITQGAGVTVAVIDSGVDPRQPDLAGNVVDGVSIVTKNGDGTDDTEGHGTGMAAIIAGHGHGPGNADGVLGIAPQAKILPVQLLGGTRPVSTVGGFAAAVDAAVQRGAKVISASIESMDDVGAPEAVARAVDQGVVVVAGTGNDEGVGLLVPRAPGRYPGVIAVGATDRKGNYAGFSVEGSEKNTLMLVAPGVDGINANPDGTYATGKRGTSMSTAIVAGAVALIRSKYPDLPVHEIWNRLRATAVDKGLPGFDTKYGNGLLDLNAALTRQVAPTTSPTPWVSRTATPAPSTAVPATANASNPASAAPSTGNRTKLIAAGVGAAVVALGILMLLGRRRRGQGPPGS